MIEEADTETVRKKKKGHSMQSKHHGQSNGRTQHDQTTVRRRVCGHRMSVKESGRADLSEDLG